MCDESAIKPAVLVVEDEVLVRAALAEYLRHCGYRVIQAASHEEAITVLHEQDIRVDVLFNAIASFDLTQQAKKLRPKIQIVSVASLEKAAHAAGDLCEDGPQLKKPYEPSQVIDWIKRLQAVK